MKEGFNAVSSEIIALFFVSALTDAPAAIAFPGFPCAGEAQVMVIKQVTFDIIKLKLLLQDEFVIFALT